MASGSATWAIYARQSLDRTGAGLAVARQIADCKKLGKQLKLDGEPVVYVDNDKSASTGRRRPDYERLLKALRAGQHHAVVAWHTDRLHRRPIELEDYISVSETHGVLTHTVQRGPLDLSTADGQLQARIAGAVARHEVQHKSVRRSRAAQQKAERGGLNGGGRSFGDGRTVIEVTRRTEVDGVEVPRSRKVIEEPGRTLTDEERDESRTSRNGSIHAPSVAGSRSTSTRSTWLRPLPSGPRSMRSFSGRRPRPVSGWSGTAVAW